MMSRHLLPRSGSWQRRLVVSLTALGIVVTTGCGGDDSTTSAPTPSVSSSPSGSPSESASASPPTEPSVTPATGTTYDRQTFSFTLPPEFVATGDVGNGVLRTADFGAEQLGCYFSVAEIGGADIIGTDLEDAASQALATAKGSMVRQPDREVGGKQVYVLSGSDASSPLLYEVGRVAGNKTATINFAFFADSPDNQALIDSILATVTWND